MNPHPSLQESVMTCSIREKQRRSREQSLFRLMWRLLRFDSGNQAKGLLPHLLYLRRMLKEQLPIRMLFKELLQQIILKQLRSKAVFRYPRQNAEEVSLYAGAARQGDRIEKTAFPLRFLQ